MSDDESKKNIPQTLWEKYKQTVTPLKKTKKQAGLELQKKVELSIQEHAPKAPSVRKRKEGAIGGISFSPQGSLQYKSQKKIRKTLEIQGRLDLHGMTQEKAYKALVAFIHNSFSNGKQDLIVITGKGIKLKEGKTEGGILRRQLPLWLENPDLHSYVHFYTNSHPFEGGSGAFYLRLRKNKL